MSNKLFALEPEFRAACEAADIKPTSRQAGKFRRGTGLAFRFRSFIHRNGITLKDFTDLSEEAQFLLRQRARVDFSHS